MLIKHYMSDPNTILKLQNGQTAAIINATSLATNGTSVPSTNFAYSVWFYINNWNYRYGEPKVIFGRMSSVSSQGQGSVSGINGLDPCPSVVLGALENNISISLGCYPGVDQQPTTTGGTTVVHTCSITNVPIQKWVNLTMSVYGRSMDVYIDGKLVKTCLLPGIANVNNSANIYVTPLGGFDGWTSKLQYYPNALNPQDAWNIYSKGYTTASLSSLFGAYQVEVSLIDNGTTQNSVTF